MLKMTSVVHKAQNSATHYITVPASIVHDSAYPFTDGELITVELDVENKSIVTRKRDGTK